MASKKKNTKQNKIKKRTNNTEKEFFSLREVLIITILAIVFGWLMGSIVTSKTANLTDSQDFKKLRNVYNHIVNNYYKKVDRTKLIEASIDGMLEYLDDPNTIYMDEKETESFNQVMSGEYKGVGVSIVKYNDDIYIIDVFKNSPADKAGLKVGDIITEFNGKDIKGLEVDEVAKLTKNKKEVKIKIKRKQEQKELNIKLEKVVMPSVSSEILEKNGKKVGLINISVFASNTSSQFKKELRDLEKKNIDSYIIDVRSNSGGYLSEATNILSEFMDSKNVIYQIKTNNKTTKYYSKGKITKKYKVVVLIDENSASASEVVAAALKESYNAEVVGKKSYGKGTVQQTSDLAGGGTIKYTVENWLTPKGNYIDKKGIEPTVEVDLNEEYFNYPTKDNDTQLQKALDVITKSN